MNKLTFLTLAFAAMILTGCAEKKSTTKITNNNGNTSPIITPTSTPLPGDPTNIPGCDGVYRAGASSCYYSILPTFSFSGSGAAGYHYWSSATDLPGDIDPNIFRTDANFAVRIKPVVVDGGNSIQGRNCSQFTKNNFTKLQVKVMLRRASDSISSNIKTLTANVGSYSNTARFTVPGGTSSPYVIEIYSILSNHRCNAYYGSAPSGCPNSFFDIPVVVAPNPTECVGFELEFATDSTYDLPN